VPPDELRAALEVTAARAAAVEAEPPVALPDPPQPLDADRIVVGEATQDQARSRRAALDAEFMAWLSEQLEARTAEVEALRTHVEAVEREVKRAVDSNVELADELRRVHAAYAEVRRELEAMRTG
jgi:hypothetical protein